MRSIGTEFAWALDFVRAINARPKLYKIIMRPLMGKLARYELYGLCDAFVGDGICIDFDPEISRDISYDKSDLW